MKNTINSLLNRLKKLKATITDASAMGANNPELSPIIEQISNEAELLAKAYKGPTPLISALNKLELSFLTPLAAERHYHATTTRIEEAHTKRMIHKSPIFPISKKNLIFAPVGAMSKDELNQVEDRLQFALTNKNYKTISFCLKNLSCSKIDGEAWMIKLQSELKIRKINCEIISHPDYH